MQIVSDSASYVAQQEVFTGELIGRLVDRLEEAGISGPQLKELTGKIAFDIACMIDDVTPIEFEGLEVHPCLTFMSNEGELNHLNGNSYTHELVFGILNAMFLDDA